MKATFRTFESGAGDCIFLVLKDEKDGSSHNLMVDCNVLTPEIKLFILEELNLKIDTLIVTHIDADHAKGVTKLMQTTEFKDLQIGRILFKGFQPQTDNPKKLNIETKGKLDDIAGLLPPVVDEFYHKCNGMHAACLIAEMNKHLQWKEVWQKEPILEGELIVLGNDTKWGCLRFLSPTQAAMNALLREVKLEYARRLGVAPPDSDFEDQDKYFELMLRLAELRKRPATTKKIGAVAITKDLMERYAKIDADESNVTAANNASLAFCWEVADPPKRILFMGDAVSSQLLSQLNKISVEEMWFEAIKVSHHGSKNNTSISLSAKVDSKHYFITGGKNGEGPHIETIAKIAMKPLQEDKDHRELHYNHTYGISLWKELEKETVKSQLDECHLKMVIDNTYEFEY